MGFDLFPIVGRINTGSNASSGVAVNGGKEMLDQLEAYCATPNQRFVCYGAGNSGDRTFTASISHTFNPPASKQTLNDIKGKLGDLAEQFLQFYARYDGATLFCDSLSDTAGFHIAAFEEWEWLTSSMLEWWDMLDDEEREEAGADWLEGAIAFAEVPHSGNYFALVTQGKRRGQIVYSQHDGLESPSYAKDLFSFIQRITADPVKEMYDLGCYARYSDGETSTQWIAKELLT